MLAGVGNLEILMKRRDVLGRTAGEFQAEKGRARNAGNAVGAVGDLVPVEQDEPDDLAEAESHDGQIVAAQPQHRKAEQNACQGGEHTGQWQADPERPAELRGQQGIGVGANGVEGHVTQVKQAGQPDHDVQSPAKHDVNEDGGCRVDEVAAGKGHERQHNRHRQDDNANGHRAPRGAAGNAVHQTGAAVAAWRATPFANNDQHDAADEHERYGSQDEERPESKAEAGHGLCGPEAAHGQRQHQGNKCCQPCLFAHVGQRTPAAPVGRRCRGRRRRGGPPGERVLCHRLRPSRSRVGRAARKA